ncbi:hypothetical protein PENSPDRAFT_685178 [Peniophora sp. CONT]|nr:hypothetical protein PENSPDRAFT_685178 [Peniophora sp. CONT]
MAALLASPPMASILMNPADDVLAPLNPIARSASMPSQARPRRPTASPPNGTPHRRIKFAPLPDPRKNVLVTDAGEELPLPDVFDEEKDTPTLVTFPPSPTDPNHPPPTAPSQVLSYNLSPVPSTTSLGLSVSAPSSPRARRHSPARDANAGFAKKFLRPFRPRSRSRDRADASAPSTPATPRFDASMLGAPLSRWTSAGSSSSNRTALGRVESREKSALAPSGGARLMLNGRTYGGRRERQGPKTPYVEPEFVEWGQGGMGAVRSTQTQWGRLQGDDPLRGRGSARTSTDNADEDDGSGMAWLRKRRAEKEAKARAEREQAGDASASSASSTTSEKSSGDGADTDVTAPDEGDAQEHEVKSVVVKQRPENESSEEEEEEEESSEQERDEEDAEADDDEEENDEVARKTAAGAGMEKVSRHHH